MKERWTFKQTALQYLEISTGREKVRTPRCWPWILHFFCIYCSILISGLCFFSLKVLNLYHTFLRLFKIFFLKCSIAHQIDRHPEIPSWNCLGLQMAEVIWDYLCLLLHFYNFDNLQLLIILHIWICCFKFS